MKIVIVGMGKLGSHLSHFFTLKNIKHTCFDKSSDLTTLKHYNLILLAIPDDQIETFFFNHKKEDSQTWVHFSGAYYHEEIIGFHPMMSFSSVLYTLDFYQNISWKIDHNFPMEQYLPIAEDKISLINQNNKAYYHALCVMAGNMPHLICQKIHQEFKKLGIKDEDIKNYIKTSFDNYLYDRPATGPIVRNDQKTIEKNMASLNSYHKKIYQAVKDSFHE